MATNAYVRHNITSEQTLYEDLIIESIQFYGEDLYYLPRDVVNLDTILNEDVESQFNDSYLVEMYLENIEGFEGEGNLLAKFGLEIRDEATFVVAKRTWNSLVGDLESQIRPFEGDLIYIPMSKTLFEISFVEHEQPFYQLSNLPVYKLQARLFEYNGEEFNTGIPVIDSVVSQGAIVVVGTSGVTGTFEVGETIHMTYNTTETLSGDIAAIDGTNLSIYNISSTDGTHQQFTVGSLITGQTSTATATIASSAHNVGSGSQNDEFASIGNDFIDFSEANPFGEVFE